MPPRQLRRAHRERPQPPRPPRPVRRQRQSRQRPNWRRPNRLSAASRRRRHHAGLCRLRRYGSPLRRGQSGRVQPRSSRSARRSRRWASACRRGHALTSTILPHCHKTHIFGPAQERCIVAQIVCADARRRPLSEQGSTSMTLHECSVIDHALCLTTGALTPVCTALCKPD